MAASSLVVLPDMRDDAGVIVPTLAGVARIVEANAHSESELEPHWSEVAGIILGHDVTIGEATYARAPKLKCVVRSGVGYNNIDVVAARRHNVIVCNVPDYGTEEVADHAMMLFLAVARFLVPCDRQIREGGWDFRTALGTPRLRGKTFGIIGCGRIGTATAMRAKAFGLDVVFYDPYLPQGHDKAIGVRRVETLEDLLEQSHFVSIHSYLDEKSRHLINAKAFARMRSGAILVNTARGPIVDQEALVEALESGHLLGAGIDVCEREPLDDDRLRNHPRVALTPHSAYYSQEGLVELHTKAAQEVRRVLLGETPKNRVA